MVVINPVSLGVGLVGGLLGIGGSRKAEQQARKDAEAQTNWENQTAFMDWLYKMQYRDYQFGEETRIYEKSKDIYDKQLYQNNVAASRSYQAENQKMDEYLQELAFNKQDLFVKMIQESGKSAVGGAQGRSTANNARGILSQYGRNSAILAESLVSRERQQRVDFDNINLQKQQADINTLEKLGLVPQKPPAPPLPIPRPVPGSGGGSSGALGLANVAVSAFAGAI